MFQLVKGLEGLIFLLVRNIFMCNRKFGVVL